MVDELRDIRMANQPLAEFMTRDGQIRLVRNLNTCLRTKEQFTKLSRLSWCNFGAIGIEIIDLLDGMDENHPIL